MEQKSPLTVTWRFFFDWFAITLMSTMMMTTMEMQITVNHRVSLQSIVCTHKKIITSHKCPKVAAHDDNFRRDIDTTLHVMSTHWQCAPRIILINLPMYLLHEWTKNAILCIKTGLSRVGIPRAPYMQIFGWQALCLS